MRTVSNSVQIKYSLFVYFKDNIIRYMIPFLEGLVPSINN